MGCLDDNDVLALMSGTVTADRRSELEAHLDQCDSCRHLVAASAGPLNPAQVAHQLGRYSVLKPVGTGAMGVVYAAYDPQLDRRVALKLLHPGAGEAKDLSARLLREAQAMARLSHPNVITVHDVGVVNGQVFVAMEFVEGCTLRQWLQRERPFREILRVFVAAGRGLAAAHAAGLVHRDFKPDNVLISDDGRVRVTDFGLARADPNPRIGTEIHLLPATPISLQGFLVGSPAYMAPEQLRGEASDARADQFSFCVALHEALTGEPPFAGTSIGELESSISSARRPELPRTIPRRVRSTLERGLAANREQRFPSLDELLDQLEKAQGQRIWPRAAVIGLALLVLGSVWRVQRSQARLCTGSEAEVASVWSGARREQVKAAFAAAGIADAAGAAQRASALLDRYAQAWAVMHREACEATHLRGEQSEQMLDLRMGCLQERRRALEAAATVLAAGDSHGLARATDVAASLPDLAACADLAALRAQRSSGPAPGQEDQWSEARELMARSGALTTAGSYSAAFEASQKALQIAVALGSGQLEGEARLSGGRTLKGWARNLDAEAWTQSAIEAAEKTGDALTLAGAFVNACALADLQDHLAEGRLWARYAAAALARAGGSDDVEQDRLLCIAEIEWVDGNLDEALALTQRWMALANKQDAEGPRAARAHDMLGSVMVSLGRIHDGRVELESALRMEERLYGPRHSSVSTTLASLGGAMLADGQPAEAIKLLERALRIDEEARGGDSTDLISTLAQLGEALGAAGRLDEALAQHLRAVRIGESKPGGSKRELGEARTGLGNNLLKLGRPREALAQLVQAETEQESADPVELAECWLGEAQALVALHREPARARQLAERARAAWSEHARKTGTALYSSKISAANELLRATRG